MQDQPDYTDPTTEPTDEQIESMDRTANLIADSLMPTSKRLSIGELFGKPMFLAPARPEPFTFSNGTRRIPLADVLFDLGGTGLMYSGAQIVDEQNPKRGRTIQLRMPNKGKVGGYDPLIIAETEREKADYIAWHKDVVSQWAGWRRDCVKAGTTVKPSEIKADAVVFSDEELALLGLVEDVPAKK